MNIFIELVKIKYKSRSRSMCYTSHSQKHTYYFFIFFDYFTFLAHRILKYVYLFNNRLGTQDELRLISVFYCYFVEVVVVECLSLYYRKDLEM